MGNGGTKATLGNTGNQDFDFGEQSNLFKANKGTGTPPGNASLQSKYLTINNGA